MKAQIYTTRFPAVSCSKKWTLLFVVAFAVQSLHAQFSVTGKVADSLQKPVANSSVMLLQKKDSTLVKGTLSNAAGLFSFKEVIPGNYLITYSYTGYKTNYQRMQITVGEPAVIDAGTITLFLLAKQLNTVNVTAKQPLFEQKIDRMVVNVKNSITSAGSTVLDVLERSPGIIVNRQGGSISMSGKDGVQIMINGKLNYIPAAAFINMLEGMNANSVERIELITTPPAKYDAGGNAGYINIVLAQNPNEGFNGSYSLTAAAFYGTAPAANFDFNYRRKKGNLYGGYAVSRRAQRQYIANYRTVINGVKTTESDLESFRDPSQFNNSLRLGYDYAATKKTTIGVLVSGYDNKWKMDAVNYSSTFINQVKDSSIIIDNSEVNHWKNAMANVNLQHVFTKSSEMSFNIDYLYYYNFNPTAYTNNYYDANSQFASSQNINSSKKTIIQVLPVQVDYRKKVNTKTDVEAGIKAVVSRFTNDVLVERLEPTGWKQDPEFTADYLLKENIAAAYTSVSYTANPKNAFKAGLRYEYTTSNLGTETQKNLVDRKYGYLFPTVYWSHKINTANAIAFSYNRRINRPTFNNLAPFLLFGDPNTFISGNAALQPAVADAVKVNYSLKRLVFSVGYTHEANSIGNFQVRVNTVTNKQYQTPQNLAYTKTVNATISLPFAPAKWWFSQINVLGNWQQAKADYLAKPVIVDVYNYNISGLQRFTLPHNYTMELSGFYRSKTLSGIAVLKPFGALNIAAQRKLGKNGATLKLGVDDIFSTMKFRFSTNVADEQFYTSGFMQMSRRIFKLTFTANFGNKLLKEKRARATASEDERQRVAQ